MLLKNDTRLVSGSSDAELRVWALHFKNKEKKGEVEMEVKVKEEDEGTEGPPSKMFRLDTEGEIKAEPQKDEEEVKDDAVSKYKTLNFIDKNCR